MSVPAILLQPKPAETADRISVAVHVMAEVLAPDYAQRRASGWLLDNVGNLLRAEHAQLLLGDQIAWQFQVALTSPKRGTLGYVGLLQLDAVTGEVLAPAATAAKLHQYAGQLAQRPTSQAD